MGVRHSPERVLVSGIVVHPVTRRPSHRLRAVRLLATRASDSNLHRGAGVAGAGDLQLCLCRSASASRRLLALEKTHEKVPRYHHDRWMVLFRRYLHALVAGAEPCSHRLKPAFPILQLKRHWRETSLVARSVGHLWQAQRGLPLAHWWWIGR